ncbi:Predicted P-loop ATPase and inactivated derivatives [Seinonella peptonophila]|uniref:Predicted P-loop ATPase and inactivated derivatives n=1 Tax=Seinonella peptonophila TaxID=112248 RepID=A0A1M5A1C8_9BACL|nr:virulence-associated E family protein [Seinonella peptonophila]SHF23726.1 Predicted P-loop ATPase and inactivated derivatives [Seinonella peptonophila]
MEKLQLQHDGAITIAVGQNRKETQWKNRGFSWTGFLSRISKVHRTSETFLEYKTLPKRKRDEIKDVGGFVGGTIQTGRRKAENVRWRSIITLDADYANHVPSLKVLHYAAALYTTHSHHPDKPRFRIVIPLQRPVTPEEYPVVARRIAADIDIEWFDDTTFEPHRMMYWPSASEDGEYTFMYQDCEWMNPDEILAEYQDWKDAAQWPVSSREMKSIKRKAKKQGDPLQKSGIIGAFCRTYTVSEVIDKFLPEIYEKVNEERYTYQSGSTTGGLVIYDDTFAYSHHATDPISGKLVNAFDLVRLHLYFELDVDAEPDTPVSKLPSYKAMQELAAGDDQVKETLGIEQIGLAKEDFEDTQWIKELERHPKSGILLVTFRNFELILENDPTLKNAFAYDEFNHRPFVRKILPWKAKEGPFDNMDDAALRGHIENKYGIRHKERLTDALMMVSRRHAFHPIKDYLETLKWDGIPRLESIFIEYLGVEDHVHTRKLTIKALVAAIKRIYEPGAKFDEMIVFKGKQGRGKSMMIARLSKGWYTDSLDSLNGKEAYESLQGSWLVELAELSAIKRAADIEQVKKFLSKTMDRYRPPYARMIEEYPRQCIFFGSTNTHEFLSDRTGNRRFWPFRCEDEPKRRWHQLTDDEIDQVWAEALVYYHEGFATHLDPEVDADTLAWLENEQHEHTEENSLSGMIEEFLEKPLPLDWNQRDISSRRAFLNEDFGSSAIEVLPRKKVCVMEVWTELLGRDPSLIDKRFSREVGSIIENLPGWKRSKRLSFKHYGQQRAFVRQKENSS